MLLGEPAYLNTIEVEGHIHLGGRTGCEQTPGGNETQGQQAILRGYA
jgi:hypothetical protein